jgi:hypothetical protein
MKLISAPAPGLLLGLSMPMLKLSPPIWAFAQVAVRAVLRPSKVLVLKAIKLERTEHRAMVKPLSKA